jgi:hypothetical protein
MSLALDPHGARALAAADAAPGVVAPPGERIPRVFQILIVLYVVFTGEIPLAVQAAMFGLTGGGEEAFTVAVLLAVLVDITRMAPIFVLARHPLGILHPLIIAVALWPLLVRMPTTIEEFGGLGGLFLGAPVSPPFFHGLGWRPGYQVWWATAVYNAMQILWLLSAYVGFSLTTRAPRMHGGPRLEFASGSLRRLLIILIVVSLTALFVLLSLRGGLASHLADLSRGRFRSLAGLGPLITLVDLGTISLVLWVAARPRDAKTPIFLAALAIVSAAQFISNGSRSATFLLFMLVGLAWALRTRRVPWRVAAMMAPLIFTSLGFLSIVRMSGLTGQTATEAIATADASSVLTRVQDELQLRQSMHAPVPVIEAGHRVTDGPLMGQTYLAAILAFVPRSIWEDKPRGPGSIYAQNFLGELREGTAVPIGPIAEAHWNFGILGVILLAMIYGLLIRKAHDVYMANQDSPFVLCFFVLFVTTFRLSTDDLVLVEQQLTLLAGVYLIARLALRRVDVAAEPAKALAKTPSPAA